MPGKKKLIVTQQCGGNMPSEFDAIAPTAPSMRG
jgi:hypothetical protein